MKRSWASIGPPWMTATFQHPLQIIALGGVELVPQKRREVIDSGIGVGGGGAIPACLLILVRRGFSRDLRHDRA